MEHVGEMALKVQLTLIDRQSTIRRLVVAYQNRKDTVHWSVEDESDSL